MTSIKKITYPNLLATIAPSKQLEHLIQYLYLELQYDSVSTRRNTAAYFILLAKKTPVLIKELWKDIEIKITKVHSDKWKDTGNSSDCTSKHTDNGGIGVDFPPYPFND
jgi:hypothetical protein